ncbi:DEAD/DEAH box helicase family protein [Parendozoicomonas haliclonae]|nr:DEAD/DEAH box helicase family protein [Parendozoicomonas haliclonae]
MLRTRWPELANLGAKAEEYLHTDPESCLVKLRNFLELTVRWLYRQERLPEGYRSSIYDLLHADVFQSAFPKSVVLKMDALRIHGNRAAHGEKIKPNDALWLMKEAFYVGGWVYLSYGNGTPESLGKYQEPKPPQVEKAALSQAELQKKQEQLDKARAELEEAEKREISILRELQQQKEKAEDLNKRMQQTLQRNEHVANLLGLDEAETRRRLIDSQLRVAGWDVGDNLQPTIQVTQEEEVFEQPTQSGVGYADYVLWDDNGKPMAVIEAKRTNVDANNGRKQAQLYANWLEKKHGQRPVIFYTNGHEIHIWDDHPASNYPPRMLFGFYSPDSLHYLIQQRGTRKPLNNEVPIDTGITNRLYQLESITRVSERFMDKHRKALVVQATGTGKTRVAISLTKRLLQARWAKRVLFLCDRKELRNQASQAFNEFLSEPICQLGVSKKEELQKARIIIATYPGMIGVMDKFDVGYFDLIIADESHRSIYNVYGDLFKYFDALQVGLTATPVEMVCRSTFSLFGHSEKVPTAEYSLEAAIADNHLTPFEVISHTTQFLREGIKKDNLTAEQIAELEEQGYDPNTMDFEAGVIDKAIYNRDTNRAIMRNLMENGIRDKDEQLPGKSIVFARNLKHAKLLEEVFREMYPQYGGQFCMVIGSHDPRAQSLIGDFKGDAKNISATPAKDEITIAISVDMLDTGIDVPSIVNLVFAKPVRSPVKFWQMIGRGTRLCPNLFGPGEDKQRFVIFDHWGNFEFHSMNQEEGKVSVSKPLAQKRLEAWVELGKAAQKEFKLDELKTVTGEIAQQIQALDKDSIAVKEKWQVRERLSDQRVLEQFAPQIQQQLVDEIGPLMQWVDVRGQGKAMRFDMDMIAAQTALFGNPDKKHQLWVNVVEKVERLPVHLGQVQQQGEIIKQVRDQDWWNSATFADLEHVRTRLRGLMYLMEEPVTPPPTAPAFIDVKEDAAKFETKAVEANIKSVDFKIYRQQVQGALEPLFTSNSVLLKIRNGQPVSDNELDDLAKLVLIQNPNVDIRVLKDFYPEATASLDQILRTLVGMDRSAVAEKFAQFAAAHNLSSQQIRFLDMLKNHIRDFGTIEMKALFTQPFTHIHSEGLSGLFPEMEQMLAIKEIVDSLNVPLGEAAL